MNSEKQLQADIARLLELIESSNEMIRQLKNAGNQEDSLPIRQEKHLRKQYTSELNTLLKKYHLTVAEAD